MPLLDTVGINCEKAANSENRGAGVKYMDDCVCVVFLDMTTCTSLVEGESHGILLFLCFKTHTYGIIFS